MTEVSPTASALVRTSSPSQRSACCSAVLLQARVDQHVAIGMATERSATTRLKNAQPEPELVERRVELHGARPRTPNQFSPECWHWCGARKRAAPCGE